MDNKKKLKINIKFNNKGKVECAKSPELCNECKEECEKMDLYYDPFNYKDLKECFKNSERSR